MIVFVQQVETDGFTACRAEQTDGKRHHSENQMTFPNACCHTLFAPDPSGRMVFKILQRLIRCKLKDARGLCLSTNTLQNASLRKRRSLLLPLQRPNPAPSPIFVCNGMTPHACTTTSASRSMAS